MAKTDDQIDRKIRLFLNEAKKKYHLNHVYIFGSYARGTATEWSDIDVAIVSQDFSDDILEDRLYLMKLALRFDDRIEPVLYRPYQFNHNEPLADQIFKNGIRII